MTLLLWLDCETGGTSPIDTDLLQAAFIVTNSRNVELGRLNLLLRPSNNIYRVTADAMRINGIDLQKHQALSVGYDDGAQQLRDFLAKFHASTGKRLKPAGWNPSFGVSFVNEHLMPREEWLRFCSYGLLDLQSVVYFLAMQGVLPAENASMHMHEVAASMGVDIEWSSSHDALEDAAATFGIYLCLDTMFKGVMDAEAA